MRYYCEKCKTRDAMERVEHDKYTLQCIACGATLPYVERKRRFVVRATRRGCGERLVECKTLTSAMRKAETAVRRQWDVTITRHWTITGYESSCTRVWQQDAEVPEPFGRARPI